MLMDLLRTVDVEPAECVVIESSVRGAAAAKQAGCYCVVLGNEYASFFPYTARRGVEHVRNTTELRQWFEEVWEKPVCSDSALSRRERDPNANRQTTITTRSAAPGTEMDALAAWLKRLENFDLASVSVIGNFVCNDRDLRAKLKLKLDAIMRGRDRLKKPRSVMLCAEPGSGKTFLGREFAREVGCADGLIYGNLADAASIGQGLQRHYSDIVRSTAPLKVAFLDEVDTAVRSEQAYRFLTTALDGGEVVELKSGDKLPLGGLIWFFAASAAASYAEWAEELRASKNKGADLAASRFDYSIDLPALSTPGEAIVQAISIAATASKAFQAVESRALLYIGWKKWESSRALRKAVTSALGRQEVSVLQLSDLASSEEDDLERFFAETRRYSADLKHLVNVQRRR
jgi:hypothetical protein